MHHFHRHCAIVYRYAIFEKAILEWQISININNDNLFRCNLRWRLTGLTPSRKYTKHKINISIRVPNESVLIHLPAPTVGHFSRIITPWIKVLVPPLACWCRKKPRDQNVNSHKDICRVTTYSFTGQNTWRHWLILRAFWSSVSQSAMGAQKLGTFNTQRHVHCWTERRRDTHSQEGK